MFLFEPLCQGLCGSQKYTAMPGCSLSFLYMDISLPWVFVMLNRIGCAMPNSLSVKACKTLAALAGLNSGRLTSNQSAGALDQGSHCTGIAFPLDEISFPLPGELAIFNLWRAHMDAQHVGDLASAVLAFATRQSFVVGVAQGGDQFLAQLAHGHGIGAVVDGFV